MSSLFLSPFSTARPEAWTAIPPETLELIDNGGKAYLSPEGRAALNRIAFGEWYLVKNSPSLDDVLMNRRCEHCNQIHPYLSVACTPAPLNGLRQLHVFLSEIGLREYQRRLVAKQPVHDIKCRTMTYDDITVISAADAKKLNDQIRSRRNQPPIDQHPPRADEVYAEAIRHRITSRMERIKRGMEEAERRGYLL